MKNSVRQDYIPHIIREGLVIGLGISVFSVLALYLGFRKWVRSLCV